MFMLEPSLLDNDLYKLTQMQAAFHQTENPIVDYAFKCRSEGVNLTKYIELIENQIRWYCALKFKSEEIEYLRSLDIFAEDFLDYLKDFQLDPKTVFISWDWNDIVIRIRGHWVNTILFEVPVLAIVNEVYFRNEDPHPDYTSAMFHLREKINDANEVGMPIIEMGTRRRRSRRWQYEVVSYLKDNLKNFGGTSNVYLAWKLGIPCKGTQAHEWFQAYQALSPKLIDFQKNALNVWYDEYGDKLAVALTDIVGIDAFCRDLSVENAKRYRGFRHDSGNTMIWYMTLINRLAELGVDPSTKTFIFSDGLDVETASSIMFSCGEYNQHLGLAFPTIVFGIGTNLTNDFDSSKALSIVMKMVNCDGKPVAKLSDSPGKSMCEDRNYMVMLRDTFQLALSA